MGGKRAWQYCSGVGADTGGSGAVTERSKVMAATRDWSGTEVTTREGGRRKVSVHHGVQERIDSCHRGVEWVDGVECLPLGKGKDDSCFWESSIYQAF